MKTKTKSFNRVMSFVLCAIMLVGLVPMQALAWNTNTAFIEMVPPKDLTLDSAGESSTKYDSPNYPQGGSVYDIAVKSPSTKYNARAFCANHGWTLKAGYTFNDVQQATAVSDVNTMLGEAKAYLDFYYYVTHTDEGRALVGWDEDKASGFGAIVQAIVWLNLDNKVTGLSQADRIQKYAEEAEAIIKELNKQGANITNGGAPYTAAQCASSIEYMRTGGGTGGAINVPEDSFSYYVVICHDSVPGKNTKNQRLIVPYYTPVEQNDEPVYITFNKVDGDGAPLGGASFTVFNQDNDPIGTVTSSTGTYVGGPYYFEAGTSTTLTVIETTAPAGYIKDPAGKVVTVSTAANGTPATAAVVTGGAFKNTPPPPPPSDTPLIKIDADTGIPLAGGVFEFVGASGTYTRTTGANGAVTIDVQWSNPSETATYIPAGTYTVTEIQPPDGYTLNNTSQTITFYADWIWNTPTHGAGTPHDLGENQTCVQHPIDGVNSNSCGAYQFTSSGPLTFRNYQEKTIELLKVDETGKGLAGAQFAIYRDNQFLFNKTTNSAGLIVVPELKTGTYRFEEIKAPAGYIIPQDNTKWIYVDVEDANIRTYTMLMTNYDIPEIRIAKEDENTGYLLAGAQFQVTIQGTDIGTYATGAGGTVTIPRTAYAHLLNETQNSWIVTAKEVSPPTGYFSARASEDTKSLTMTRGTKMLPFVFKNAPYFDLDISKYVAGTNTLLDGAKFDIYVDNVKVFDGISGDSGTGLLNIDKTKLGTYLESTGKTSWVFKVVETAPPDGHLLSTPNEQSLTVTMGQSETVSFSFGNPEHPEFKIYKTNDKNEPLEGAHFTVYIDNHEAFNGVTGKDGYFSLPVEQFGNYLGNGDKDSWIVKVIETQAPDGYLLPIDNVQEQTVVKGQKTVIFSFVNTIYPEIKLYKTDSSTNAPLPGALFEVRIENQMFGQFFTDDNGEIIIRYHDYVDSNGKTIKGYGRFLDDLNMPAKTDWQVEFREITAPKGYLISEPDRQTNTLVLGQTMSAFAFTNSQYPEVVIRKYDSDTEQLLSGAIFEIQFDGHTLPGTFMTDKTGTIRITHDIYGAFLDNLNNPEDHTWTVTVTEKSAPKNYFLAGMLTDTVQTNAMVLGQSLSEFVYKNEPFPDVEVFKKDSKTDEPLAGVTYELISDNKQHRYTARTGADGIARFELVPEGTYTLSELSVPTGYILSTKTHVVISEPGKDGHKQTLTFEYENDQTPTLKIIKLDSITGDPIANVKFNISYKPDGHTGSAKNLGDFTTNKDGEIIFTQKDNLETGWYVISEPSPPYGYQYHKDDGAVSEIHLQGNEEYVHTVRNTPLSAIIIRKIDSATGLPVPGTTFTVSYLGGASGSNGTNIGTYVTSINGSITIPGLEAGTYVVEETKPAPGYELSNPSVQTAFISGKGQDIVELVFGNAKQGTLSILKLDSVTRQPLKNATFKVTDSNGTPVGASNGIFTTDAEGLIQIDEFLPVG